MCVFGENSRKRESSKRLGFEDRSVSPEAIEEGENSKHRHQFFGSRRKNLKDGESAR